MKLNLLPKTVAKSVQGRSVMVLMALLVLATAVGSFLYWSRINGELGVLKQEAQAKEPLAQQVVATAAEADSILNGAKIVLTNSELVTAIDRSNMKYPKLYDELLPYIPSFFRMRSITAASAGPTKATVTITGYLKTFQQYADVMIALLRFPNCNAVGRSGFGPVAAGDQGPFGYNPDVPDRGPIPGWSAVTLTMSLEGVDLQAPEPMTTLRTAIQNTGAGATAGGAGVGPTPGVPSTGKLGNRLAGG